MCGLVGVASLDGKPLNNVMVGLFKQLLYLDVVRGDHSTGICKVDTDGVVDIHKNIGPPSNTDTFKGNQVFDAKGVCSDAVVLIGHNRYATQGGINLENAHPFTTKEGSITGAHNGTVGDWILKNLGDNPYDTDSEFIFNCIESKGLEDTIKKLKWGAYTLTWWDSNRNSLNFIRNSERPLHICKIGDCLVWASEEWMIEVAVSRKLTNVDPVIGSVKVDNHLEYVIGDTSGPIIKEVKPDKVSYFSILPIRAGIITPYNNSKGHLIDKNLYLKALYKTTYHPSYLVMSIIGSPDKGVYNYEDFQVRAYLNGHTKSQELLRELLEEPVTNEGDPFFITAKLESIKYLHNNEESYGVVDLRSFSCIECLVDDDEAELKRKWYNETSCGCCHCSAFLSYEDREETLRVDNATYFCKDCVNTYVPESYGIYTTI